VEDEIVVVVVTAAHGETREKQRSTTTAHDTTATRHTAQLTRDTRQRERHSPLFTRLSPTLRRLCRCCRRRRRYFSRSVCVLDEGGDLLDPFRSPQRAISSRECASGCNSRRDGPVSARESCGTLGSRVEFLWSFLRNDEILAKRVMRTLNRFLMNLKRKESRIKILSSSFLLRSNNNSMIFADIRERCYKAQRKAWFSVVLIRKYLATTIFQIFLSFSDVSSKETFSSPNICAIINPLRIS